MQDLTGRFPAHLVPSSMSGGNTVADDPGLAMTAPGSPGVMPMPDAMDNLPLPDASAVQVRPDPGPVTRPGHVPWRDAGSGSGSGPWQETP